MMLQMIYRDVLKFMAIYLFIAVAFAQALYLLAHDEVRQRCSPCLCAVLMSPPPCRGTATATHLI